MVVKGVTVQTVPLHTGPASVLLPQHCLQDGLRLLLLTLKDSYMVYFFDFSIIVPGLHVKLLCDPIKVGITLSHCPVTEESTGFGCQGFGSGGATGAACVRSCQKLPPCPMEPVPAGSKTDLPLPKAKPISDGGSAPVIT